MASSDEEELWPGFFPIRHLALAKAQPEVQDLARRAGFSLNGFNWPLENVGPRRFPGLVAVIQTLVMAGLDSPENLALLFGSADAVADVHRQMRWYALMPPQEGSPAYASGLRGPAPCDPNQLAPPRWLRLCPAGSACCSQAREATAPSAPTASLARPRGYPAAATCTTQVGPACAAHHCYAILLLSCTAAFNPALHTSLLSIPSTLPPATPPPSACTQTAFAAGSSASPRVRCAARPCQIRCRGPPAQRRSKSCRSCSKSGSGSSSCCRRRKRQTEQQMRQLLPLPARAAVAAARDGDGVAAAAAGTDPGHFGC